MANLRLQEIPLDAIEPDPDQPRDLPPLDELKKRVKRKDNRALEIWARLRELSASILEQGLQQPILVYPSSSRGKYIIYDGQRRWMATSLLAQEGHGDGTIQCYVRPNPKSDDDVLLGQLDANVQRQDLNVFELARGLQKVHASLKSTGGAIRLMREDGSVDTAELHPGEGDDRIWDLIEKKMGISRSRRYQIQAVLKLPPKIQRVAEESGLPESKLRYLIPLKDEQMMRTIIREMVDDDLSNADIKKRADAMVKKAFNKPSVKMPKPAQIRGSIKPVKRISKQLLAIKDISKAVNGMDPRTIKKYGELIPELHATVENLKKALEKIERWESTNYTQV